MTPSIATPTAGSAGVRRIATKSPFSGKVESPRADIGERVLYVLKSAFIRALQFGLERDVSGAKDGEHAQGPVTDDASLARRR